MDLYHMGTQEIPEPDIRRGRRNADLGQGFYLTTEDGFARRWAQGGKGKQNFLNHYELDTEGLTLKRFERDEEWFSYLYANRAGAKDSLPEVDVVIGPIANDTIYDTQGIITSGFLSRDQALALLLIGPVYQQVVIRSEKALSQLRFLGAEEIREEETASYRDLVRKEEEEYKALFAGTLEKLLG